MWGAVRAWRFSDWPLIGLSSCSLCSASARKRYLPRIKLVSDSLGDAKTLVGRGDWAQLEKFANKEADDCTLPMKVNQIT